MIRLFFASQALLTVSRTMASPLPAHGKITVEQFLADNHLPSDCPLEPVTSREGRYVLFCHHEGLDYAVKYFDPKAPDAADEFAREHRFHEFLRPLQTGQTPALLAADAQQQTLLMTRVAGRGLRETEITRNRIERAGEFLQRVNSDLNTAHETIDFIAQGGCQSIGEHLAQVATHVADIQAYEDRVDPQSQAFINDELSPIWQKVLSHVLSQFETMGIDVQQPLDDHHLILSPGELNFQNAILTPEQDLCFVDFDQAGWDDPARVIGRFFTLGTLPPKLDHWDTMIELMLALPQPDPAFAIRAKVLLPVYQVARACLPLIRCLQEEARQLSDEDEVQHSKTKLITLTGRSRQWLLKANQRL